ncbi:MBL fold metallo-hydrolase [Sphingobacterium faecium]|uniref:MBL fold metallo-hydrolase n=1 Tax=Sphingobacterium faecium TaxID=34087 RepID=UPI0024684A6A|nr:MBL fold metallo-hydrolase [Sphingobacterium faecium]MDH5826668.1 MBL fold metallo-hydrolase [Sphingobacterium faecium]
MKKFILGIALGFLALSSYGQAQVKDNSSIQLIRNATVVLKYGEKEFLIDPLLANKGAYAGFEGTANSEIRNPMVELPVAAESLLNPDAIIVTHMHADHWDDVAIKMLPKDKALFAQNEEDSTAITAQGFTDVRVLSADSHFGNIKMQKTHAQHGSDEAFAHPLMAKSLGQASGIFFNAPGQKSLYIAGDAIWTKDFEMHLKKMNPEVVVLNTGDAQVDGFGAIIMGKEDVYRVHQLLPDATIIAIHMEAINHCVLTRKELTDYVTEKGIADKVIIPADGQVINL